MGALQARLPQHQNRLTVSFDVSRFLKGGIHVSQKIDEEKLSKLSFEQQEAIKQCLKTLSEIQTKVSSICCIVTASLFGLFIPMCTCFRKQELNFENEIQEWLDESNKCLSKYGIAVVRRRIMHGSGSNRKDYNWVQFLLTEDEINIGMMDALKDQSKECCCCCSYDISRVPSQQQNYQIMAQKTGFY